MKTSKTTAVIMCLLVAAMAFAPPTNAQFLNKLSKGLEKVNKGLDKAEKALSGDKSKSNTTTTKQPATTAPKVQSDRQNAPKEQPKSVANSEAVEAKDMIVRPHLTTETRFICKQVALNTLENNPVSEGIFALPEYNPDLGYGMFYGFWTIDGKCLFEPRYQQLGDRPVFDSGAAVVKGLKNDKGVQFATILYADGSVRELPESYKKVSQFHDGIATVETGGWNVKTPETFCIDTQGKRVWPTLGPGSIMEVGYLRDGLRRVKVRTEQERFRYVTRWGFINNFGKWVIKPTLKEVREFKNGYALVIDEADKLKFIDTKGATVCEIPGGAVTLQYAREISDISDGYFVNKSVFYDLTGKEQKRYYKATGFTNGYAFVRDGFNEPIYVINTRFEPVRTLYGVDLQSARTLLGVNNPLFGKAGVGTIDRRNVVTPRGDMLIIGNSWPEIIGDFFPDEYAPCQAVLKDVGAKVKYEYLGYINRKGEFEVVFSDVKAARGPFVGPFPINDPNDSIPEGGPWPPLPPGDTIPKGPKNVVTSKYCVRVIASPDEGGKVVGGGEFKYGDTITVGAKANEGWHISDVVCSNRFAKTSKINKFVVRGDMDIMVYFLKDDDVTPVRSGTYSGDMALKFIDNLTQSAISVPVYLETSATSAVESPYGKDSQGFLAVMINPDETYVCESPTRSTVKGNVVFSLNAFFVPMKVKGVMEDAGKTYMLLDGGDVKINNLKLLSSGAQAADVSAFESVMVNLMLMFDGVDVALSGASYRVEMLDVDSSTGAFTFGMLQRKDTQRGWIAAGSDVFAQVDRRFFSTTVDYGIPADYFKGIRMTPSAKRNDVLWQPTAGFFENNPTMAESFAAELGKSFRAFQSECDLLKGVTFRDFADAYERVLKMK